MQIFFGVGGHIAPFKHRLDENMKPFGKFFKHEILGGKVHINFFFISTKFLNLRFLIFHQL